MPSAGRRSLRSARSLTPSWWHRRCATGRSRAEKAIAELPAGTPAHGVFSISLANDPPYTATSLLLLGRFGEAEDVTRQVIATFYGPDGSDGPGQHPSGFART